MVQRNGAKREITMVPEGQEVVGTISGCGFQYFAARRTVAQMRDGMETTTS